MILRVWYSKMVKDHVKRSSDMKHVIFDCDSTAGIPGYPMDDALALFYLLGRPEEAEVLGITCTFGNGTADQVYSATSALLSETGWDRIPLYRGAGAGEDPKSPAARFIKETVNARPGEISFVGIGSLTNLYGAYLLDSGLFGKLKELVLMGGYTAPVLYHGKHLDELNFSVNPKAAACVLNHGRNISILTGNNTLKPSWLPKEEFVEKLCGGSAAGRYLAEKLGYRFDVKEKEHGEAASYCWDVVASVYLLHPELYTDRPASCYVTEKGMHSGWLGVTEEAPDTCLLNLPEVRDLAAYRKEMYGGWLDFKVGKKKAVICFTRVPRPGTTKTRLLPVLSPEQCAGLHRAFLEDLSEVYRKVEADVFVAYTEDPDWEQLKEIFPAAAGFFAQSGDGLGERMDHALKKVLALGYDAAVLTGTDLPLMKKEHLESGFLGLQRNDLVLGPTSDGGYYMIGTKKPCSQVFTGQQYGGGSVFENTWKKAEAAGLRIARAPGCDDVDTPEDLRGLADKVCPASRTGRYLEKLRKEGVCL